MLWFGWVSFPHAAPPADVMILHQSLAARAVIIISLVAASLPPSLASGTEPIPLTTAAAVARSNVGPDDPAPPVRLDAVVTHRDADGTIFLRDDTGSTFISQQPTNPQLAAGERVQVEGVVHRGLLINGIRHARIEQLGVGPRPEPTPISPQQMKTGVLHYNWVRLEGVGRRWRRIGEEGGALSVNVAGTVVEARLEHAPADDEATAWVGARVRLVGIAAGEINDRRQLVRPYLLVPDSRAVTVIESAAANPFALPEVTFADLGRSEPADELRRVSGVVAAAPRQGRLFLTDGDRGLCVDIADGDKPLAISAGDRIDAVGFPDRGPFATRLVEAHLQRVAVGPPPVPVRPSVRDLQIGCDAQLIQIEIAVAEREERAAGTLLVGNLDGVRLRIIAPASLPAGIAAASQVRVTAPCLVTKTTNSTYSLRAGGYDLFPVVLDDIVLVASPPWWTPRRLAVALVGSLAAGLAALAWVVLLRRQVRRQLAIIERQIQSEAVAQERQRIAREFHDSLEQDLAGLALRIDSAAGSVSDPAARRTMERQREILARLQEETRQYVWDLREPTRLQGGLADRAQVMVAELRDLFDTPLELNFSGSLPALPTETSHHVLRMLREAINNAAHHAAASKITVGLAADERGLVATIADDGAGFETTDDAPRPAGHFGLRGLTERAARIGGRVTIASRPGHGTTVTIHVPHPA
jgi:signal transduction histidine kinase